MKNISFLFLLFVVLFFDVVIKCYITSTSSNKVDIRTFPKDSVNIEHLTIATTECTNGICLTGHKDEYTKLLCNGIYDLTLVIDESQSIGKENWEDQVIPFTREIVNHLNVAKDKVHVGIQFFSDVCRDIVMFGSDLSADKEKLIAKINSCKDDFGIGGGTFIVDALNRGITLYSESSNSRKEVPKVTILFTDGNENKYPGFEPLQQINQTYKAKKIKLLVVGVYKASKNKLNVLGGCDQNDTNCPFVIKTEFNGLQGITKLLTDKICNEQITPPIIKPKPPVVICEGYQCLCVDVYDLTFIIDESRSIGIKHWKEQVIPFTSKIVHLLNIGKENIHVGIQFFSNLFRDIVMFGSAESTDKPLLISKINSYMRDYCDGDGTFMVDALRRGIILYSESPRSRKEVPKVTVLFTDGKENRYRGVHALQAISKLYRRKHIKLFIVGVHRASQRKMNLLVGCRINDTNCPLVIKAEFNELQGIAKLLIDKICKEKNPATDSDKSPPIIIPDIVCLGEKCLCEDVYDVTLIIEESENIGKQSWKNCVIPFTIELVNNLNVAKDKVHVGIQFFSCAFRDIVMFGSEMSTQKQNLISVINSYKMDFVNGCKSFIVDALHRGIDLYSESSFSRKVPKVTILLTYGNESGYEGVEPLQKIGELYKDKQIKLLVVGVNKASERTLNLLAGCKENDTNCPLVINTTFDGLQGITKLLTNIICNEKAPQTHIYSPIIIKPVVCEGEKCVHEDVYDITLIIDESKSIGKHFWKKQVIPFTSEIVNLLNVGEDKIHVGIQLFSNTFRDIVMFGSELSVDKEKLINKISSYKDDYGMGVGTYIVDALHRGVVLYSESPYSRKEVPKVTILFTDGNGNKYNRIQPLLEISELYRNKHIKLIVVGVHKSSQRILNLLVGCKKDDTNCPSVIRTKLDKLQGTAKLLVDKIYDDTVIEIPPIQCKGNECLCKYIFDLALIVEHTSNTSSLGNGKMKNIMKPTVVNFLKMLEINQEHVHISFGESTSSGLRMDVTFKDPVSYDKSFLISLAEGKTFEGVKNETSIAKDLLQILYTMFDEGHRTQVPKLVVLLTDSVADSSKKKHMKQIDQLYKKKNIKLIIIYSQRGPEKKLKRMLGCKKNNLRCNHLLWNTFHNFHLIEKFIKEEICPSLVNPIDPVEHVNELDMVNPIDIIHYPDLTEPIDTIYQVDPVDNVNPINLIKPVDPMDAVHYADLIEPIDTVYQVDPVDKVDSIDTIKPTNKVDSTYSIKPGDKVDSIDTNKLADKIDSVDSITLTDKIDSIDTIKPVDKVDSVDTNKLVDPIVPMDSTTLIDPIGQVGSLTSVDKVIPADTNKHVDKVIPMDSLKSVDKVVSINSNKPVEMVDPVYSTDNADTIDLIDSPDMIKPIDPLGSAESLDPINPVYHGDMVDSVNVVDESKLVDDVDIVDSVDAIDTVYLVDDVDPIHPVNPDCSNPLCELCDDEMCPPTEPLCENPFNIAILLDQSKNISSEHWENSVKPFTKRIVERNLVSKYNTHVTLMSIHSCSKPFWDFKSKKSYRKHKILRKISKMKKYNTKTKNVVENLSKLRKSVFKHSSNSKKRNLIIMFVEGKTSNDLNELRKEIELLHFNHIELFVYALENIDEKEYKVYGNCEVEGTRCVNIVKVTWKNLVNAVDLYGLEFCNNSPLHAQCNDWNEWSACPNTCTSSSYSRRERKVPYTLVPESVKGKIIGKTCEEQGVVEYRACVTKHCDKTCGGFGEWSGCSRSCGEGQRIRYRNIPKNANKECHKLNMVEVDSCNEGECIPINSCGDVGIWSEWSECSATCGYSTKHRRFEISKEYLEEYPTCKDYKRSEVEVCEVDICKEDNIPVCFEWSQWSEWSATCGPRTRVQKALIKFQNSINDNNRSTHCDEHYADKIDIDEAENCLSENCGEWSIWSTCDRTCDHGVRVRHFISNYKTSLVSNVKKEIEECANMFNETETETCLYLPFCEDETECNEWEVWVECPSVVCSSSIKRKYTRRTDLLKNPIENESEICSSLAQFKEEDCPLSDESKCIHAVCNVWDEWGSCSSTCGESFRIRKRKEPLELIPPKQDQNGNMGLTCEQQNVITEEKELCDVLFTCEESSEEEDVKNHGYTRGKDDNNNQGTTGDKDKSNNENSEDNENEQNNDTKKKGILNKHAVLGASVGILILVLSGIAYALSGFSGGQAFDESNMEFATDEINNEDIETSEEYTVVNQNDTSWN